MDQNDYPSLNQTLLFVRRCFANRCLPHDVKLVEDTLQKRFTEEKIELLIGDRAYDSDPLDERLQQPGIQLIAPPQEVMSVSLFRIYQEALRNIAQHAGASDANVRFSFEEEVAVLEIEDNGKGIDPVPDLVILTEQGHYGLAGMKERVEALGGDFQLRTNSNQGTTITVKVLLNIKQS